MFRLVIMLPLSASILLWPTWMNAEINTRKGIQHKTWHKKINPNQLNDFQSRRVEDRGYQLKTTITTVNHQRRRGGKHHRQREKKRGKIVGLTVGTLNVGR